MLHVLVQLNVKDFAALAQFEQRAAQLMAGYGGQIVTAFETAHHEDGTGKEVHFLTFPDEAAFDAYRQDPALGALATLREQAIAHTEVSVSVRVKTYR